MIDIYWSSKKSPVSNAPEICVALLDLHPVAWLIFGYIDYIWMVYIYGLDIGWIQMMYEFCMGYIFIYINDVGPHSYKIDYKPHSMIIVTSTMNHRIHQLMCTNLAI